MDSQPIPAMSGYGRDRDGGERRAFTQPSWERTSGGGMGGGMGMDRGSSYGAYNYVHAHSLQC